MGVLIEGFKDLKVFLFKWYNVLNKCLLVERFLKLLFNFLLIWF